MKQLLLLRHGHAAPFDTPAGDHARPLERRGVADIASVAQRLRALPWYPDLVLASSARRTQETARTLAKGLDYPESMIVSEPQLYNADLDTWQALTRALPATVHRVAMIGHNPGISQFAQWLLPRQRLEGLRPGTSLLLECQVTTWAELAPEHVARIQREAPQTPVGS